MSAHTLSIRTGITESSLSNFFHGMSLKQFNYIVSKLSRVLNITSITNIFDKKIDLKDFEILKEDKDYFDTNILLPEYKKEFLRLIEKKNKPKKN